MVSSFKSSLKGIDCSQIDNRYLTVCVSVDFGPRVLGLSYQGGENLLAVLPDAQLQAAGGLAYHLWGGHRLWVAPERPEITYLPDDQPPRIEEITNGLEVVQEVERSTGIQKSWRIRLVPERAEVVLDHRISNQGTGPIALAPWAVTMLPPGGVGLLPLPEDPQDEHGLWPNRQLVFWPYTDLESSHIKLNNQALLVTAEMRRGALKVGVPNPLGWIAYRHKKVLFVKKTRYLEGENYLDRGASHQIYCDPQVIELETLGPQTTLNPGQAVDHQELWQIYPQGSFPQQIQKRFVSLLR